MNGESHDGRGRLNRVRGLIAAVMVLLAMCFASASQGDDQNYPVTAAEAARMKPHAASTPASAPSPVVTPPEKFYEPAGLMMSAPGVVVPAKPIAILTPATAPIASAPAAVVPASLPSPGIAEPAATSSPMIYSSIPAAPTSPVPIEEEHDALERPTYAVPVVPHLDGRGEEGDSASPEMEEIPQAGPSPRPHEDSIAMAPPPQNLPPPPEVDDLGAYMRYDTAPIGMGSPDVVSFGEEVSPIGLEMREAHRRLKTGESAGGLLILKVVKDSAAARAGLHPFKRAGHTVLEGIAIGAAMVFPPAILAVPVIDYTEVGESYDMIIGVDGSRVANVLDFEDRMRGIQPGQTVYFNVVRNGERIQIPVLIPAVTTTTSFSASAVP